jgi:hypothetical protein
MKNLFATIVVAALLVPVAACAGELIAHPSVNLTVDEVRELYLGERQFAGKLKLVPVDNIALRSEFLSKVIQTDERKYVAHWLRRSFHQGLEAPVLMDSDVQTCEFVRSTPGAVGYVSKRTGTAGTKILAEF